MNKCVPVIICSCALSHGVAGHGRSSDEAREELLGQFPQWKLNTFQNDVYTLNNRLWDVASNEVAAAGTTVSFLVASRAMQGVLQQFFGGAAWRYGSLASDIAVGGLTSYSWKDFGARAGIAAASWMVSGHTSSTLTLLARYLLSHWYLLSETFPDILQMALPGLRGETTILCGRGGGCQSVQIRYFLPGGEYTPDTGRPWLELTFPPEADMSGVENQYGRALLRLREWAGINRITRIHLYPDTDNGHRKLWIRYWTNETPSQLHLFPGVFSQGSGSWWWTDVMAEKNPEVRIAARRLINPLHYHVIANLPAIISGDGIETIHISGDEQAVGELRNLVAVSGGDTGFLLFDRHRSQEYELPEIWMVNSLPLDHVMRQAVRGLDLRRAPAPWRGVWKLGASLVRSSIHRGILDWAVSRIKTEPKPEPRPMASQSHSISPSHGVQTVGTNADGEESTNRENVQAGIRPVQSDSAQDEGELKSGEKRRYDLKRVVLDFISRFYVRSHLMDTKHLAYDAIEKQKTREEALAKQKLREAAANARAVLKASRAANATPPDAGRAPVSDVGSSAMDDLSEVEASSTTLVLANPLAVRLQEVESRLQDAEERADRLGQELTSTREYLLRDTTHAETQVSDELLNQVSVPGMLTDSASVTNDHGAGAEIPDVRKVLILGEAGAGKYSAVNWMMDGTMEPKKAPAGRDLVADYSEKNIAGVHVQPSLVTVSGSDVNKGPTGSGTVSRRIANAVGNADKVIWCSNLKKVNDTARDKPADELFDLVSGFSRELGKPIYTVLTHSDEVLNNNNIAVMNGYSSSHAVLKRAAGRYQGAKQSSIGSLNLGISGYSAKPKPPLTFQNHYGSSGEGMEDVSWLNYWKTVLTRDELAQNEKSQEVVREGREEQRKGHTEIWKKLKSLTECVGIFVQ